MKSRIAKSRVENLFIGSLILIWTLAVLPPVVTAQDVGTSGTDVVLEEDFTTGVLFSGWPRRRPKEGDPDTLWPTNGGYRMRTSESLYALAPRPEKIGDVSVAVDATVTGNDELAAWGVICRASFPALNHYYLGVLSGRGSLIAKRVNGELNVLSVGDPSDAVTGKTDRIRGDCVGNRLTLYVNERKLLEAEDNEFTSGGVGLNVEGADLIFDNFRVTKPVQ